MLWNSLESKLVRQCSYRTPLNEALRSHYYIDWKRMTDLIDFRNYLEQKSVLCTTIAAGHRHIEHASAPQIGVEHRIVTVLLLFS